MPNGPILNVSINNIYYKHLFNSWIVVIWWSQSFLSNARSLHRTFAASWRTMALSSLRNRPFIVPVHGVFLCIRRYVATYIDPYPSALIGSFDESSIPMVPVFRSVSNSILYHFLSTAEKTFQVIYYLHSQIGQEAVIRTSRIDRIEIGDFYPPSLGKPLDSSIADQFQ